MTDDLELRLRDSLAAARLPSAPPSLSRLLAELAAEATAEPIPPRRRVWPRLAALVTVAIGIVAFTSTTIVLTGGPPTGPATPPSPSPSVSPDTVEGLHVYEVGELQVAMAGPNRPSGRIALRGYWSDRTIGLFCDYVESSETNLEMNGCMDTMRGITELSEPFMDDDLSISRKGPALTPWIPPEYQERLFGLPWVNGQRYPPVPIVVIGHIDDPRASECNARDRQKCLDRFVIEEIVSFDPSAVPTPSPPTTSVGALRIHEVSELEEAMAGADRPSGPIALRGYWSFSLIAHSCAPRDGAEAELLLWCTDGDFGITEQNEPMATWQESGVRLASGPALTPYVQEAFRHQLFSLPVINGQPFPPVPIIVIGHIDDLQAAMCPADVRRRCTDRFVIDDIVTFDPQGVPTPAPTPSPTPFPFDSPPPAPFTVDECLDGGKASLVDWMTLGSIGMGGGDEVYFVVISRVFHAYNGWTKDPASGRQYRDMAQRVCYAREWEQGAITFGLFPSTAYREWDDGTRTPIR